MDGNLENKFLKQLAKRYTIEVTRSEPQIVDAKVSYYVQDKNPSPRQLQPENKFQRKRSRSKCEGEDLERKITQAIRDNLSFETLLKDLGFENKLKINNDDGKK
jgi:hypothetical protein